MCLGIPGRVVEMLAGYGGQLALVDVSGEHRKVNVGMLPDETLTPGDWVIIHMGFRWKGPMRPARPRRWPAWNCCVGKR